MTGINACGLLKCSKMNFTFFASSCLYQESRLCACACVQMKTVVVYLVLWQREFTCYNYWGCSAPLTKLLGVPEHLQPPPSYAYVKQTGPAHGAALRFPTQTDCAMRLLSSAVRGEPKTWCGETCLM